MNHEYMNQALRSDARWVLNKIPVVQKCQEYSEALKKRQEQQGAWWLVQLFLSTEALTSSNLNQQRDVCVCPDLCEGETEPKRCLLVYVPQWDGRKGNW